jgi:uroporphyrinogen-III synthase
MPDSVMEPPLAALHGRRVVVTRPAAQAGALAARLREYGAEPVLCPAIRILPPADRTPLDAALAGLASFDWIICTSTNAVDAIAATLRSVPTLHARIAAVGPATRAALRDIGCTEVFVPTLHTAEVLATELPLTDGVRVFWPRGDLADDAPRAMLASRGASVEAPVAYRTEPDPALQVVVADARRGAIDAVTFTSPSTVRAFAAAFGDVALLRSIPAACIGPVTGSAARAAGFTRVADAATPDDAALCAALERLLAPPSPDVTSV